MRVLVFTPWFPAFPGDQMGSFVLDSVEALAGYGHEIRVLVSQPWRPRLAGRISSDWAKKRLDATLFPVELGIENVPHLSAPRNLLRRFSNWSYRRATLARLSSVIQSWEPDVVHAHTELPGCVAVEAAQASGVPVVVTMHGINKCPRLASRYQTAVYRKWLPRAKRVVLVGAPLTEHFEKLLSRDDFLRIVPNGLKLWERPAPAVSRPWQNPVRLISISNLHEGKGIDITLRALQQIRHKANCPFTYTVVGDGRERQALEQLARSLGVDDLVEFRGGCSHREVPHHLRDADIFVLPSYREAFGIAYLEAMAYGLLAIGVQGQGPSAFIRHGANGLLVAARSVSALADCLCTTLNSPTEMQQIAQRGQDTATEEFSLHNHAYQLTRVFHEAVLERA